MAIKALLFDTDGTLTNYWDHWYPAYKEAAKLVADGLNQPELEVKLLETGGMDVDDGSLDPFGILAAGSTAEVVELWSNQVDMMAKANVTRMLNKFFQDLSLKVAPTPTHVGILFQRLQAQGYKIGIAGAEKRVFVQKLITHYKLDKSVTFWAGGDSGFGNKFDSGMVTAFARAALVSIEEIAMIGDTTTDMEDARGSGAGMAIAVLTGSASRAILEPISDAVITDIGAIESVLAADLAADLAKGK